jgi:SAM-dependent methyltransferase
MPDVLAPLPAEVRELLELMACPWCRARIAAAPNGLRCTGCPAEFPARDGIFDLARRGTAETWGVADAQSSSQGYQEAYAQLRPARDYNNSYEEEPLKRMSTARERKLIARQLGQCGKVDTLLELPCGGGRLSPSFAPWTKLLVQADTGWGQLLHANQRPPLPAPRVLMAASGFHIPFKDASLDGVACIRLNHHLPTADERLRLMHELLRVAKRYVLMTFFDYHSLKNRIRRQLGKTPKLTMTLDEVERVARERGAKLVSAPMISWMSSGHRYALMVKDG